MSVYHMLHVLTDDIFIYNYSSSMTSIYGPWPCQFVYIFIHFFRTTQSWNPSNYNTHIIHSCTSWHIHQRITLYTQTGKNLCYMPTMVSLVDLFVNIPRYNLVIWYCWLLDETCLRPGNLANLKEPFTRQLVWMSWWLVSVCHNCIRSWVCM